MREERLRATVGLRSAPALSAWRGRSGRRYIVGVHALVAAEVMDVTDAVIIAVRRDAAGAASVIATATVGPLFGEEARAAWLSRVQHLGATEMHVHRLAYDEPERRALMDDLIQDETRQAC